MISMNKKYQTRDGKPVRLLCIDETLSRYPVIGVIADEGESSSWTKDGYYYHDAEETDPYDLVEVKEEKTVVGWVNVFEDGSISMIYKTKEYANESFSGWVTRVACVPVTITYKEGDGL